MILIKNARPLIDGRLCDITDIAVDNSGYIAQIGGEMTSYDTVIDCAGNILSAGYIDLHTHGGYGHDMMEGTVEAIKAISDFHLNNGTTTYVPTTLTADIPTTLTALDNVRHFKDDSTARRYGVHLEGPYLSVKAAGAHPPYLIVPPTEENTRWVWDNADIVSRVTVAPDQPCSDSFTAKCVRNHIQVSCGHDMSIDDEINAMVDNGATSVTHMYNCTSRCSRRTTPHKHLGLTEVGLTDDRLICEVIADNRHVPNPLFMMIYKLKGANGIALVSDSLAIADYSGGDMYLGSGESRQRIVIEDGVAVIKELNTYAGSVTPVSREVHNLVNNLGLPIEDCIVMGTRTPARLMGMTDRGDIAVGMLADFNVLDDNANILHTILGGRLVK